MTARGATMLKGVQLAMTAQTPHRRDGTPDGFRHEALLYSGEGGFLAGTLRVIRDGLRNDEPTLVVVDATKVARLREQLGADADRVWFEDMAQAGANPARIIGLWRQFAGVHGGSGRRVRGIGEPISSRRSPAELIECQRHESLLNLAFVDSGPFLLVCPYDTDALPAAVIDEALSSHPHIVEGSIEYPSESYGGLDAALAPFAAPLPEAPAGAGWLTYQAETLHDLRAHVARVAAESGIEPARVADLVTGVSEVATNSIRHGGGDGRLRMWMQDDCVICELRDRGRLDAPLAGRELPPADAFGGRGLWIANQLCDLVQVRSPAGGTVVRLHMHRQAPAGAPAAR